MLEKAIAWFNERIHSTFYSMTLRMGQIVNGKAGYDCSSAVYFALKNAGLLPMDIGIGNTDSLFGHLERNGWVRVAENARGGIDCQRGDVFIWGKRGASGGGAGHTGKFLNANDIIHCAYGYNGIHIDNHDWLWNLNGRPEVTVYRYVGVPNTPYNEVIDQIVNVGSYIKFDGLYKADDVQQIGGIWQVRTNALCDEGFTWEDNGIPAEPLIEVSADGYATEDQELDVGSLYKIPGKFKVLDVGEFSGDWLALIEWNGLKFWADIKTATEVGANDAGTPTPPRKPVTPPVTPTPETPPVTPEPPVIPDTPVPETPPVEEPPVIEPPKEEPKPPVINPKEDKDMAFTPKQQRELKIATESVQKTIDDMQYSPEIQKIVDAVSAKTKMFVYFIADSLIGLGLIVPGLAIVFDWTDVNKIVALSGVLATSGTFILVMFGIYKSKAK